MCSMFGQNLLKAELGVEEEAKREQQKKNQSGAEEQPVTWDYCLIFEIGDKDKIISYGVQPGDESMEEDLVDQATDYRRKVFKVWKRLEDADLLISPRMYDDNKQFMY
eukprot:UN26602